MNGVGSGDGVGVGSGDGVGVGSGDGSDAGSGDGSGDHLTYSQQTRDGTEYAENMEDQ